MHELLMRFNGRSGYFSNLLYIITVALYEKGQIKRNFIIRQ